VDLLVETSGPDALFTVRDQGIGIPEADARQLFTAFHRGSNVGDTPGSGLGLLIARSCAELHGGTISFESRVGQGTSFFVSLPLLRPPAPPHPVPALPRQPAESAPPA
jgi:signal transduction histidine kinase